MREKSEKLAHLLARHIVSEVGINDVGVGEALESESEMIDRYEVSRGSLREALRILEILGFVQMRPGPHGGPVVLPPDSLQFSTVVRLHYQRIRATYGQLLETRLALEPHAAAMAGQARIPEAIERLETYLEQTRTASLADDRNFRAIGQDFHDHIAAVGGNRIVNVLIRNCYDVFAARTLDFPYSEARRQEIQSIHEQIAQAVISGRPRTARSLMYDHMQAHVREATSEFSGLMSEVVSW